MNRVLTRIFCAATLFFAAACSQDAYDVSRGIDREVTLFSDEVSIPIADIGPLSPRQLFGDVDLGSALGGLFKEDEEGYLVVEKEETIYSNLVLLTYYMGMADHTRPLDVNLDDFTGYPGAKVEDPVEIGFTPAVQEFSLYAVNPLTEGIAVSGKLTLSAFSSEEYDKVSVPAESQDYELFRTTLDGERILDVCSTEHMVLHLPASFLEKDPLGGLSSFVLGYRYKAQLALGTDFPESIPIPIDDLDLPIGKYRVKEVLLTTDVSNEIPVTLVLESVEVRVKETDEEGRESIVECDDVSITPGLTIASGSSGAPVVTPLAVTIRAREGTLPDIAGLCLNLSVKAPAGEGDKRLNMNQTIRFNNLRATVSGGITIQGL